MNLQQLEYIIAVDAFRHFGKAAKACFVTQPTLSTMIQRFEEELGICLFDRSHQPILPTEKGKEIIEQAKKILFEANRIKEMAIDTKDAVKGELRIGVIPTIAPYLLPLFINDFLNEYPEVKLRVNDLTTNRIIQELKNETLDAGILATPLNIEGINEEPLFYEQLMVYVSENEKMLVKKFIQPSDIDVKRLWLLEEGHCLRSQILRLCEMREGDNQRNLEYEAGSVESLLKIVEMNSGLTVLPELTVHHFDEQRKKQVRYFKSPVPVREVSLVTHRHFVKQHLLQALQSKIQKNVKVLLSGSKKEKIILDI